jgi:hypothetical protein
VPEQSRAFRGVVVIGEDELRLALNLSDDVEIAFVEADSNPATVLVGLIGIPADSLAFVEDPVAVVQSQERCSRWPIIRWGWPDA